MEFISADVLFTAFLIFVARFAEVALATLRMLAINQGRRWSAVGFAFLQMVIWTYVVSKVLANLDQAPYVVAFASGFALGTYGGMVLETWMGQGHRVVRIFSRQGEKVANQLREEGFRVTSFNGEGRDGPIQILFVEVQRRRQRIITALAKSIDPDCYYLVDSTQVNPA